MNFKLYLKSRQELNTLLEEVDAELLKRSTRKSFIDDIIKRCEAQGITVEELLMELSPKKPKRTSKGYGPVPTIFDSGNGSSWSGRGMMPSWLKEQIRLGKNIEGFYVGPADRRVEVLARYK